MINSVSTQIWVIAKKSKVLNAIKNINKPVQYKGIDILERQMKIALTYLIENNLKRKNPTMNVISSYWDYQLKFNNNWDVRFNYFKKNWNWDKTHLFDFNIALFENWKAKIDLNTEEPIEFFEETWINNYMFENYINNNI